MRSNDKYTKVSTLAVLDGSNHSVFTIAPSSGSDMRNTLGKHQFSDPRSMSALEGSIFVSDYGAGTIFESSNSKDWVDIRSQSSGFWSSIVNTVSTALNYNRATAYFFPQMTHPQSALPFGDFIYVLDKDKLYAYLMGKDKLVPLSYKTALTFAPERILVDQTADQLLFFGPSVQDSTNWPLLVPMTVEVDATEDVSASLAALYRYLWDQGYLPTVSLTFPCQGMSGKICEDPACIVDSGRGLLPKTNVVMEHLLCDMNSSFCSKNRYKKFKPGQSLLIPDVPFEPLLSTETGTFDGNTTIQSYVQQLVPDKNLLMSINDGSIRRLNPNRSVSMDSTPSKGISLTLPVQHNRYYLAIARSELFSNDSGLARLVRQYPSLSIRPYGTSSRASAQNSSTQEIAALDSVQVAAAEKTVLKNIGYKDDRAVKYGRATDVSILIAEPSLDCQHPAFFGSAQDDRAFSGQQCNPVEEATTPSFIPWSDSASRHGTCVASIIGARSAPYGPGLAPGAELTQINITDIDSSTLQRFYKKETQPFIVNVSSGDVRVTAYNTWRHLLTTPLVDEEVLFVAAADNDDNLLSDKDKFPALLAREFPNLISVGALDSTGKDIWEDTANHQGSNTGEKVELLAPGDAVPCAIEVAQGQALYSRSPGTSFAAPLVSAVAALLLEKRLSPGEVKARLLATADPLTTQRLGQPLALFGRLNIDYALLNPKVSHFEFEQQGNVVHLDADVLDDSEIKFKNPMAPMPAWTPISFDEVLAIRSSGRNANDEALYRLVRFDSSKRSVELSDRVLLDGCLQAQSRKNGDTYLFTFGAGCPAAGQQPDQSKVINGLQVLIAPTLGAMRFRKN